MSDPTKAAKTDGVKVLGSGYEERIKKLEAEVVRLTNAITDAMADLTPGVSPYGILEAAVSEWRSDDDRGKPGEPYMCFRHDGVVCISPSHTCKGCKIFSKGREPDE